MSAGQRETNFSLESALNMEVWLESLDPAFGMTFLGSLSAARRGGSVGNCPPNTA